MKKFYSLIIILLFGGLTGVFAQDSSGCNAFFQATVSGNVVFFRAMDSMPGVRHTWYFGDGGSRTTDSIVVNHSYSYGNFLVTQVVVDSAHHCQDSSMQYIDVPAPPPSCSIYITETNDSVHHQYSFVANAFVTPGAADTVRWTINDSLVGTGDTLNRTLTGGPYTVCAYLSTSYSCQSQSCLTINPQDSLPTPPPPPPDTCTISFTAEPKAHHPDQYDFTVVGGSDYDSINWTINGADSLFAGPFHGQHFNYTFRDTGYYLVYVTAKRKHLGCFVSNAQAIHIDSLSGQPGIGLNSYPNPATTQATVSVTLTGSASIDIRVYNSMGGLVSSQVVAGSPGVNPITIPVSNLPIGIYYIEVQYGGTVLRSKIQKL